MNDITSIYFNLLASLFNDLNYNMPQWPIGSNKHDSYIFKPKCIKHRKKFLILSKKKQIKLKFKNA